MLSKKKERKNTITKCKMIAREVGRKERGFTSATIPFREP